MLARLSPFVLLAAVSTAQVSLPTAGGQRFVDFHADLAHPGAAVVVGTLAKWKEGKRERLADGRLGGSGAVASVSGTQYFKVPVTAALQPRATFHGDVDKPSLAFEIQLARLPDGKEQRQTASGAQLAEGALALFVLVPKTKKELEVRHVIVFDPAHEQGADKEAAFVDAMCDCYTVNRRMHDLTAALAAVDAAKDEAAKKTALGKLREVHDAKPDLKQARHDGLLTQHVAPLERRAEKRLAEATATDKSKEAGK